MAEERRIERFVLAFDRVGWIARFVLVQCESYSLECSFVSIGVGLSNGKELSELFGRGVLLLLLGTVLARVRSAAKVLLGWGFVVAVSFTIGIGIDAWASAKDYTVLGVVRLGGGGV